MSFGTRIRQLRQDKGWTLRDLAPKVKVGFTYLSKVENGKLEFGKYPSADLVAKLAKALSADEDELMLLAGKMPEQVKRRIAERPDVFLALANCDDAALDRVKVQVAAMVRRRSGKPRKPRLFFD